ncbi:MAG: TonB-dependent receptor [Acidobacteria bacterium]|nr:TonB-dependent receptor [Acidobacteriota bacterium]
MCKLVLSLTIILAAFAMAAAQSQSTTGNIDGHVVDPNGAVVPGVTVTATNVDTGFTRSATSDGDGNYTILLLPPGNYKVDVGASNGFAAATYNNVRVTVGAKTPLEVKLSAGGSVNVVDVTADGQIVEASRTSIATTIDQTRVSNLPTNGRNFLDFATLTPGIVKDPTRAGDLAVGGQKGTLNSVQIDGASSDNTFFGQSSGRVGSGRAPSQFSIDTVKEFQVNQNGFSAEYGRAAGAVVNVVTKSGTNDFHGSAFEYYRSDKFNSRNPNLVAANRVRPPGKIHNFGGTAGGPISKDKVFFFAAYEGQRSNLPNPVIVNSLPFAPANVITFLTPKVASYNVNRQQDTNLGKVDFNINAKNQVWVRFNQQKFTGTNLENGGIVSAAEHTGNSNVNTSTITGAWISSLRPTWFNEFRYQWSRDREPGFANTSDPEVSLTASANGISDGTFTFGRNNFSPRETTIKRNQFIDSQTIVHGNHTIKYGADLLFDSILNFFPGFFSGSYTFPSYAAFSNQLANPLVQSASRYRQSFAGTGTTGATTHPNNKEYGFFFQDDWRVTNKLTLNLGVRWDYQAIAKPPIQNPNAQLLASGFDTSFRPSDKNNFAPRFGFSYAPDAKTVIRGGYGMYYGRTPAIMTGTAHSQNGIQVLALDINCTTSPALCPLYPAVFANPGAAPLAPINLYLFAKNYAQPFTHQARFQYEREIFKATTVSLQYTMFKGHDLGRTRNANLSAPVPTIYQIYDSGGNPTPDQVIVQRFPSARPNSAFQRISLFESSGRSFYNGFTIEMNSRFFKRWIFNTSYTGSVAKDNKPDQTAVVPGTDDAKLAENNFDLSGEYGTSDLDMRLRFVGSAIFDSGKFTKSSSKFVNYLLSDFVWTTLFQAESGVPYSALVSGDPNNDGNTANDRVPGTLRNQFRTKSAFILDMRLGRAFRFGEKYKLSVFAEGFNVTNRANQINVNNTQYSANNTLFRFTKTTNFQTPRQFFSASPSFSLNNSSYNREVQLGVRFDW